MQHYQDWSQLPELIKTTAIYRSYLAAQLSSSTNVIRDLKRYELINNMLFAYPVNDLMPAFYESLAPIELEVILQMHGVDVDEIQ